MRGWMDALRDAARDWSRERGRGSFRSGLRQRGCDDCWRGDDLASVLRWRERTLGGGDGF